MKNCVVCKKKACGIICDRCGFDHSKNYEHFSTLSNTLPNAHPIAFYITQYKKEKEKKETIEAVQEAAPLEAVKTTESHLAKDSPSEDHSDVPKNCEVTSETTHVQEEPFEGACEQEAVEERSGIWRSLALAMCCVRLFLFIFSTAYLKSCEFQNTSVEAEWDAYESIYYDQVPFLGEIDGESYIVDAQQTFHTISVQIMLSLSFTRELDALPCERPVLIYGEFDREDEEDV